MDKKLLEEYRSNREEMRELRYKLDHLGEGDSMIGNDVIMDYRDGFPRPQSVVGYDYAREEKLRELYIKRLNRLAAECMEVEKWIEAIPDSVIRRIFRMYYTEHPEMTQQKIARKLHMDKSTVCRKIDAYLKVATKATKAML